MSLTACASNPPKVITQTVKVLPPDALLQDCPAPIFNGATNGDLLYYALDLKDSLRNCNQDKALLRQWKAASQAQN